MKIFISTLLVGAAALAAIYFLPGYFTPDQNKFEQVVLHENGYSESAREISAKINDLSPTPPTSGSWMVREVEFVKGEPYAFANYDDSHNVFRILLEIGFRPYSSDKSTGYRVVATFEPQENGWRLTHGEDLAKGKETVKIKPN